MKKIRLDLLTVEQGLAESVDTAKKVIIAGWIKVDGETIRVPSLKIPSDKKITIDRPKGEFVSRGGDKLQHALKEFGIDMHGLIAVDLGASTGGFTDCMLKSGAVKVYAVDVGYNQLDYSLRIDPRVVVLEKTHAKDISSEMFAERIDLFTADLSFISILRILPAVHDALGNIPGVVLVKPQFEAEPSQLSKGIVESVSDHKDILARVVSGIIEAGFSIENITWSPIKGHSGNIEFLLLIKGSDPSGVMRGSDPSLNKNLDELSRKINEVIESAHNNLQQ